MKDYRAADHKFICQRLRSIAEETNDAKLKMAARIAALAIETLLDDLARARGELPKPIPALDTLASHVYRAGETLFAYDLIDSRHLRFDHLHTASRILSSLREIPCGIEQ